MKPDFIGIGAARAGTTWVFRQLEQHPDVWIPRRKELHYFTRSTAYSGPSHLSKEGLLPRIVSPGVGGQKYRSHFLRALASNVVSPSWAKFKWDARYFLGTPNSDWYRSLFEPAGDRIAGEITPRYSILTRWDIQQLKKEFPKVKVFFVMRDPVERIWSLLKYHEKRWDKGLTTQSFQQLLDEAFHPAKVMQSDYEHILSNWRSVFPESQLFTCFYDQIIEEPEKLSRDLCSFLALSWPTWPVTEEKVNASTDKSLPAQLRHALVEYYLPMVERLSDSEGGYFTSWLESYRQYLDGPDR